jgi:hypothetical protein
VTPKSAGSGLKWFPDDRYLLVNLGNRVTVLETTDASPPRKFSIDPPPAGITPSTSSLKTR